MKFWSNTRADLPPVEQTSPLANFLKQDVVAAFILLAAALSALIMVNVGYEETYHHLWESLWGVKFAGWTFEKTLHYWINEGLMAIFFFLVGLEIKRELIVGELASLRKAMLPVMAAVGGMLVPAAVYAAFNFGTVGIAGWGVPMATDIAFAIGVMSLLGKRVPLGLSVFLIALAIVDDLGAVLVIALFYSKGVNWEALVVGGVLIVFSYMLSRAGVRTTSVYFIIWILIWLTFLESGIHATIAGVLVAFTIPANARYETPLFTERMNTLLARFRAAEDNVNPLQINPRQQHLIRHIIQECNYVEAPLQRIEHDLHPITMIMIMPLFALANSGVHIEWGSLGTALLDPVTLGIVFGLLVGKQAGIMFFSWLGVRFGWAELPQGVTWTQVYGLSCLAGIGFTMSLFISQLAFASHPLLLTESKMGIFLASFIAGTMGYLILRRSCPKVPEKQEAEDFRHAH